VQIAFQSPRFCCFSLRKYFYSKWQHIVLIPTDVRQTPLLGVYKPIKKAFAEECLHRSFEVKITVKHFLHLFAKLGPSDQL